MSARLHDDKPRIIVFASGTPTGGGSGFQELVEATRTHPSILDATIVAVVSNHEGGGVREKADRLGIRFMYFDGPYSALNYQSLLDHAGAEWAMLSGWLHPVRGLRPEKTVNIHPGPLPDFGGRGMYGHHVHEAVMTAFDQGDITQSAVTMHFVTEHAGDDPYDKGPIFFEFPVLIREEDTPETLAKRVNEKERAWQARMLDHVVHHRIALQGTGNHHLRVFFGQGSERIVRG
jgi:phosphoribosylglycinamide formyltransferase-1